MSSNPERRRFLGLITAFVTGVGATVAAVPFFRSLLPAADKKQRTLDVDITKLQPGQFLAAYPPWGAPVYILKRTEKMLEDLENSTWPMEDPFSEHSEQPESMKNWHRSNDPELLVVKAQCTHLGCDVAYTPPGSDSYSLGEAGLFFCPCHGSVYDLSGRVGRDYPAPTNLAVPDFELKEGILTLHYPARKKEP